MHLLVGDALASAALLHPRHPAATLDGESITFGALDAEANRMAHALRGAGVGRGDVVAWWAGSTLHSPAGFVACARLGAVFAPLPPELGADTDRVLEHLEPRVLVADGTHRDAAAGYDVAVLGLGTRTPDDLAVLASAASADPLDSDVDETDPHILYLTSGSTGTPKGVLVSHRATCLRSSAGGGTFGGGLRGDAGVLSSFPLYHYGGWHYVVEAWLHRTTVHLVPRADADHLHAALARHRPTAMYCIPAVWERVLAEPGDLGCLRHADSGTSAVSVDLLDRIRRRAPRSTTTLLYGSSEAGPMAALRDWQSDERPGSVGRPISPGLIRIADDGEVLFRGPTLMNGYHRRPDATAEAFTDGWYRSGDLGRYDEDGYLYLTGRRREIIRSGGEAVVPAEVEQALRAVPGIADAAVVGLPDERWGEIVCAVVVPAPGAAPPDLTELRARLTGLARHKHPRRLAVVGAVPRTAATGQVMRSRLRDQLIAGPSGSLTG